MKKKIPLKYKLVVSLIILAILFTFGFSYFNYNNIRKLLSEEYEVQLDLIEQGVLASVQNADTAIRIIESQLNANMEKYTEIMLEKYRENPQIHTWDLDAMKEEFGGYDIFIINEDLIVAYTTYREDLGLDFKKFPRFAEILRKRLEGDRFFSDRLDVSIVANETRKFSYMPTPDNHYLLELGVIIVDHYPFFEDMEVERVTSRQIKENLTVDDITLYRIHQDLKPSLSMSQIDPESEKGQMVLENEEITRRAIQENEAQEVVHTSNGQNSIYRYIPYLSFFEEGGLDYWNSYLIEILFNDAKLLQAHDEQRYRFYSNLFFTMMVVGGLIFGTFYLFRKTEEGKERLETVINRTSEGYYMLDNHHHIVEVNGAFCELLGYSRDKIMGQSPAEFMDTTNRELFLEESRKSAKSTHHSFEVVFLDSKNRKVHALINSTSIKGHHEPSGYYFAFVSNITQQKEEKEELERTRDAAEAASQFKSEFLATMSHEIRTPMNGIIAMTEVLLETELDSDQRKYASIIWDSSGILMNIINDILDFSKIEAGKMSLKQVDFNLLEILSVVTDLYAPKAKRKGLSFHTQFSSSLPHYLYGDDMRIRQILNNLINNAVNFTDKGSITIGALLKEKKGNTVYLKFWVEDTGIGIEEEKIDSLFQPFTQVDSSVTRKYGGTGLGLAICRSLVDLMDGSIGFTSTLGEGSTFHFTLPLTLSSEKRGDLSSGKEEVFPLELEILHSPILVVEDNKVNQQIASVQLQKLGFTSVHIVENGREALDSVLKRDYSLILMDCQMPVMDGYRASQEIRSLEKKRGTYTPIVAMTAHSMEGDRKKCLAIGMDDYISKPVKLEVLRDVLQRILTQNFTSQENTEEKGDLLEEEVIDYQVLEGVTGVSLKDLDILQPIFETYLHDTEEKIEELGRAIEERDYTIVRSVGHFLKSSSGNLGAVKLSSLAKEMEQRGKTREDSGLEDLYNSLRKEYMRVKEVLQHLQDDVGN